MEMKFIKIHFSFAAAARNVRQQRQQGSKFDWETYFIIFWPQEHSSEKERKEILLC